METEEIRPVEVRSNDPLGLVAKRAGLSMEVNIGIWGCTICAQCWAASGRPNSGWMAAGWIALGFFFIWIDRSAKKRA